MKILFPGLLRNFIILLALPVAIALPPPGRAYSQVPYPKGFASYQSISHAWKKNIHHLCLLLSTFLLAAAQLPPALHASDEMLTFTSVVTGGWHTCALTSSGGVMCWGDNFDGELGDGTTTQHSTPVDVVGLKSGITALALGTYHSCALTTGGGVKCWGLNFRGQLGNNTPYEYSSTPVDVVGLESGVTAITAGMEFTCALTALALGDYHTCALTTGGGVKCWGANEHGQLGDGTITDRGTPVDMAGLTGVVTRLAAGTYQTCALITQGGVKCVGGNAFGLLGSGSTDAYSTTPVGAIGLESRVTEVASGYDHTCALAGDGRPLCWGSNSSGQLGDGRNFNRTTPVSLQLAHSSLTINYPGGQPGSFFMVSGWNYPPNTQATLAVNGQIVTTTLAVTSSGNFVVFLDTTGAEAGGYVVTASGNSSTITGFTLAGNAPLRPQEGGGETFAVPAGIAYTKVLYLPFLSR